MKYILKSVKKPKGFSLLNGSKQEVGRLSYEGWMGNKAKLRVGIQDFYIRPASFWSNSFAISEANADVGFFKFNWKGQIRIQFDSGSLKGRKYIFRLKNMFRYKYVLEREQEVLLSLTPKYNWKTWNYDYTAESAETFMGIDPEEFFFVIGLCAFAANYFMQASGAY